MQNGLVRKTGCMSNICLSGLLLSNIIPLEMLLNKYSIIILKNCTLRMLCYSEDEVDGELAKLRQYSTRLRRIIFCCYYYSTNSCPYMVRYKVSVICSQQISCNVGFQDSSKNLPSAITTKLFPSINCIHFVDNLLHNKTIILLNPVLFHLILSNSLALRPRHLRPRQLISTR